MKAFCNPDNCIKNHRGFSLVELIVVIAILAVIGGSVCTFIITSTNSYNRVSDDVDLQEEAQIVMNQLETMLMNAEAGVNYMYFGQATDDASDVTGSLYSDSEIDESAVDVSQKYIYIYNSTDRYVVTWDEDKQTLNYRQEDRNYDTVNSKYLSTFDETGAEDALLAEYIDGFSVSLSSTDKGIVVNVKLHLAKGDYTYQTSQNITLRNSILLNEESDAIYASSDSMSVTATYEGIVVTLGGQKFSSGSTDAYSVFLTGGADVSLSLSVLISGSGFPSQEYTASLDNSAVSKVSGSSVVISGSETASVLTLTVASKVDASLSVDVTINVKQITGVAVSLGSGISDSSFRVGSSFSLGTTSASDIYAVVSGSGNLDDDEKGVTWVAGDNCTISGSTLKITSDTSAIGNEFSFTVYSASDSSVFATYTGTVQARNTTLKISADGSVNRGGSVQVTATSEDDTETYGSDDIVWSVSVSDDGSGVSISEDGLVTVTKELDYNTAYTITVTAALSYNTSVTKSIVISVPAVSVLFASSESGVYASTFTVPMVNYSTGSSYTVYYTIDGVEDATLSFKWNTYSSSGDDITTIYSNTVSVGDSSITFTKKDFTANGKNYYYSWYPYVVGTAVVDGNEISGSTVTVNNNSSYSNIKINGTWYYIPVAETGSTALSLGSTGYTYIVEMITDTNGTYYRLTLYGSRTQYYYAWNTSSYWGNSLW